MLSSTAPHFELEDEPLPGPVERDAMARSSPPDGVTTDAAGPGKASRRGRRSARWAWLAVALVVLAVPGAADVRDGTVANEPSATAVRQRPLVSGTRDAGSRAARERTPGRGERPRHATARRPARRSRKTVAPSPMPEPESATVAPQPPSPPSASRPDAAALPPAQGAPAGPGEFF